MASDRQPNPSRSIPASICVLAVCVFLWPAIATFDPGDWPSPNQYPHHSPPVNACGVVGAWCAYQFHYYLGSGAYPLLLSMTLAASVRLIRGKVGSPWGRALGLALLVACTSASAHLIFQRNTGSLPVGHGGVIGYALGQVLRENLERAGTFIVLVSATLVGLVFATDGWVLKVARFAPRSSPKRTKRSRSSGFPRLPRPEHPAKSGRGKHILPEEDEEDDEVVVVDHKHQDYPLPSTDLLHEPEYEFSPQYEQIVRRQARLLEQTLEEFRLDARVVEIDTGPVITMFELKLGAGVKVSQIATLSNDIARALKAHAIRVVAPISGKNTVGIEVPNAEKQNVRLCELMTLTGRKASKMGLPLFLGKDAGGAPLLSDLTEMPHLLIAGTTGSGKSVCLNAIILSLLMTKRPDQVKLVLIDPKMVEMSQFKEVPHLMCPIVTDMVRAQKILGWAVTKMDERYQMIAEAHVKSIGAYNSLGKDELPYIVIVIDELADLMMTAPKEVEHHLSRLSQKSRAVGIHIIVATQRPEARIVTGLIKSNLPSRICFRVASRVDSRIVLDRNGGEVLLGRGDMLFLPPGSHKLIRAQGTFLSDAEVHAVLADLTSRAKPGFQLDKGSQTRGVLTTVSAPVANDPARELSPS